MAAFPNSARRRAKPRLPHPVDHVLQIGARRAEGVGGVVFVLVAERDAADDLAVIGNAEMIVQKRALRGDRGLRDGAESQRFGRRQQIGDIGAAIDRAIRAERLLAMDDRQLAGGRARQFGIEIDAARAFDVATDAPGRRRSVRLPVRARRRAMSRGCTTAFTSSPNSSFGTPNTATSTTFGCVTSTFSASCG
jgi:hypothetical protein